jgi:hypothetical protein
LAHEHLGQKKLSGKEINRGRLGRVWKGGEEEVGMLRGEGMRMGSGGVMTMPLPRSYDYWLIPKTSNKTFKTAFLQT